MKLSTSNSALSAIIFTFLLQVSCAEARPLDGDGANEKPLPSETLITEQLVRIRATLESGAQGCNLTDGFNLCQSTKVQLKLAGLNKSAQKIMVLEGPTLPHSIFAKNRDRVVDFIRLADKSTGKMETWQPEAEIPTLLNDIVPLLWVDGAPLSPEELEPVGEALLNLHKKFSWVNPTTPPTAHGAYVFDWLADLNPSAQFVIAEFPEPSSEIFCQLSTRRGLSRYVSFYANAAKEFEDIVQRNEIDFVNVSYATTVESMSRHYREICGADFNDVPAGFRDLALHAKASVLKRIAHARNLLVVQAAPNDYPAEITPDSNPFVCDQDPQILRVGFFTEFASKIPAQGTETNARKLHTAQRNLAACVDVWINGGMVENSELSEDFEPVLPKKFDQASLHYSLHGVYRFPVAIMATSWATPIALSMMAKIKSKTETITHENIAPEDLKAQVFGKMMDPLHHHIFESEKQRN